MEIVICSCHGRVTERLSLDKVVRFLGKLAQGVQITVIDDLCERNSLPCFSNERESEAVVIGACYQAKPRLSLWGEALGSPTRSVGIVDILEEIAMPYDSAIIAERIKLLLWAQVRRLSEPRQIYQQNLKLSFSGNGRAVSRREFLTSALLRYEVIPCINVLKCAGGDKCRICYDVCLLGGIVVRGNSVTIDNDICDGCGACLARCPKMAIYYPTYSLEELCGEMEGLFFDGNASLKPRIIAISCHTGLPYDCKGTKSRMVYAPTVLPLKLPSLGMVSPWLLLCAFYLGAQGVVLISEGEEGCANFSMPILINDIEFAQALLEHFGIGRERLRLLEVTETNIDDVSHELDCFAREISSLGPTAFSSTGRTLACNEVLSLSALIESMSSCLECQPKGSICEATAPFGKIKLDTDRCTGCGLCALTCPTDALKLVVDENVSGYQLVFRHGSCVACGTCISTCPEGCLTLRRIMEMDKINCYEPILFDRIVRCRRCGNPVAPRSMIERLRSKLRESGSQLDEQLELCPTCKANTVRYLEDNLLTVANKDLADNWQARLGGI